MREVVLDTETTGLDPKSGDRVVEIGCIELLNHIPTGKYWHEYINPERSMPSQAFEVHGLSTEFLSDKPTFLHFVDQFLAFIDEATLVIHNASFDIGFLNAELERIERPLITMDRVIDTLALARRKHPGASNSLDALCKRYQIDNSNRAKHGALLDSEILAQVYAELIGGRQADLELSKSNERIKQGRSRMRKVSPRPQPLPPRLSSDEMSAHESFLMEIGENALWNRFLR